jgi:hypothetical protein
MDKSFQNSMMKLSRRLGGKAIRDILKLLILVNLKLGLNKRINIGPSPMRCA